eukprot:12429092-Karenia_brevis.AAC.2
MVRGFQVSRGRGINSSRVQEVEVSRAFVGAWVCCVKGSRVRGFEGSRAQRLRNWWVRVLEDSRVGGV